ncbi:type VI secretion system tube protein TssD [Flavobacterium branchiarum]|uniref:Type VI secretion system tube protein TssD n=1 Tax=Flavobacterium branchiarum TaxID=1114870 RepID=A0ABV5FS55_9FLAO|nr:type VI secretion system tube protein TssD [Flavobacterium branchiarum]MDN3672791.1 type VI secretion system tube protein TssD [Flavobacterium branchiarum]
MSFLTSLTVAGKDYKVLNVNYDLSQETDPSGRPSTVTRGGRITIEVESTGSTELFEWMTNNFERKDGAVKFIKRDSNATLKELKFTEAYMVKYKENFDHDSITPLTEKFEISARKISMGGGEFDNAWV